MTNVLKLVARLELLLSAKASPAPCAGFSSTTETIQASAIVGLIARQMPTKPGSQSCVARVYWPGHAADAAH